MAKPSLQGRSLPTATGKYLKPWIALASRAITPPCGMIPAAQSEAIMVKSTSSMLGRVSHAWNLMRSGSGCPRASHSSTSSREHECQVDPVVVSTAPIVKTGSTSVKIATRGRRAAWSGKQRPATSSRGGGGRRHAGATPRQIRPHAHRPGMVSPWWASGGWQGSWCVRTRRPRGTVFRIRALRSSIREPNSIRGQLEGSARTPHHPR